MKLEDLGGEIFMEPYNSCRLIAMNLVSIVDNPFTKNAKANYTKLYEVAYEQQRLADDLVDLEIEHIGRILDKIANDPEPEYLKRNERELWEKCLKAAKDSRRTGCGLTALGDMLATLGLKYDSDASKEVVEKVFKTKMKAELDCTIDLAILRGSFEGWDYEKEFELTEGLDPIITGGKNGFFEALWEEFPEQVERMVYTEEGRRNISWSTAAPTGSLSILTQTTSGIEPLFKPYYTRRKKINPDDKEARVDFTDDSGDQWQEYYVLHPKFKAWIHAQYEAPMPWEDIDEDTLDEWYEKSPWFGSCANDIDWIERVEIQSIIQKYTSHSLSSTINVPEDITEEEVKGIYLASYEKGLKGVTIYRDNCRSGVLISNKDEEFSTHDAPKRPKSLDCEIENVSVKGESWSVIVGLLKEKPYEVFAIPNLHSRNMHNGKLTKEGSGVYILEYTSGKHKENIIEGLNDRMTDEQAALTRLCSTALRHGANVQFVCEQLDKADGDISSFTKAISRVLKKYASKELQVERGKCSNCGSGNLLMEESCLRCLDCGHSAC